MLVSRWECGGKRPLRMFIGMSNLRYSRSPVRRPCAGLVTYMELRLVRIGPRSFRKVWQLSLDSEGGTDRWLSLKSPRSMQPPF